MLTGPHGPCNTQCDRPDARCHQDELHPFRRDDCAPPACEVYYNVTTQTQCNWPTEENARREIVQVCRLLWQKGYVAATDGNVSVRLGPGRLVTTPTAVSKTVVTEEQLVLCDLTGAPLPAAEQQTAGLRPSSEIRLHCEAYRQRPDIRAVVHAHPPLSVAFSVAGVSLAEPVLPEVLVNLGEIPTTRYATPSSADGPEVIRELIVTHDALILERHGSVTVGRSAFDAYLKLEKVEYAAQVILAARQLGQVRPIPPAEVKHLYEIRREMYGVTTDGNGSRGENPD